LVSYSVPFRGHAYPNERIYLGRSDEGMTRSSAEHEARLNASQILAGTWTPPLKADYVEAENPTVAQLADEHDQRKVRKGLRPNSLADMKRKLEIHLLPHFGPIVVSELTSRDVEAYLGRKLAENRRIEAALAVGEPPAAVPCPSRAAACPAWRRRGSAPRWPTGRTPSDASRGHPHRPARARPRRL
jgi:hypothetical protein